jgi:hypothetical protein
MTTNLALNKTGRLFIVICLSVLLAVSCRKPSVPQEDSWEYSDSSLSFRLAAHPDTFLKHSLAMNESVFQVTDSAKSAAVVMLKSQRCVPVPRNTANKMCGKVLKFGGTKQAYLIRTFLHPSRVTLYQHNLYILCSDFPDSSGQLPHSAVVVLLNERPKDTFLEYFRRM